MGHEGPRDRVRRLGKREVRYKGREQCIALRAVDHRRGRGKQGNGDYSNILPRDHDIGSGIAGESRSAGKKSSF